MTVGARPGRLAGVHGLSLTRDLHVRRMKLREVAICIDKEQVDLL